MLPSTFTHMMAITFPRQDVQTHAAYRSFFKWDIEPCVLSLIPEPCAGLLQGTKKALLEQLKAIMGSLLPELLSKQPLQQWQSNTQSALLAAFRKLAIAVLRHRYRSTEHLCLLRGLLASLLHGMLSCHASIAHSGGASHIYRKGHQAGGAEYCLRMQSPMALKIVLCKRSASRVACNDRG